jgi:hypothetical protein
LKITFIYNNNNVSKIIVNETFPYVVLKHPITLNKNDYILYSGKIVIAKNIKTNDDKARNMKIKKTREIAAKKLSELTSEYNNLYIQLTRSTFFYKEVDKKYIELQDIAALQLRAEEFAKVIGGEIKWYGRVVAMPHPDDKPTDFMLDLISSHILPLVGINDNVKQDNNIKQNKGWGNNNNKSNVFDKLLSETKHKSRFKDFDVVDYNTLPKCDKCLAELKNVLDAQQTADVFHVETQFPINSWKQLVCINRFCQAFSRRLNNVINSLDGTSNSFGGLFDAASLASICGDYGLKMSNFPSNNFRPFGNLYYIQSRKYGSILYNKGVLFLHADNKILAQFLCTDECYSECLENEQQECDFF